MSIGDVVDADDNRIVTDVDVGAHVDIDVVDVDVIIVVGVSMSPSMLKSMCGVHVM